jgi:hypothetical protein
MCFEGKMKNNTVLLKSCDCSNKLSTFTQEVHGLTPYCSAVHDGIMCWPATPPGITVAQHCPPLPGFIVKMLVYRKCSENGAWQHFNDSFVVIEKTNFESYLKTVATQPQEYGLDYITQVSDVIRKTNILGMVFVLLSLLSIVISIILYKFILPKYINDILRIKIHKHLFAAVSFDMLLKFIFQISLLLSINNSDPGLLQKPVICEILITLNQYSETTILLWTAIDCHFIHVSARSGLLCISGYLAYIIIGWGTPLIPTLIWAMTLNMSHKVSCWQGHVKLTSIWIVEVPKMVCLMAILMFICMSSYRHYQTVSQHSNTHPKTISNLLTTTIMFVLLLLTFLVITIPTHIKIDNLQHKIIIQYIATILTSSKGIYVILLCNYSNIKDYVRPEPSNTDIEF